MVLPQFSVQQCTNLHCRFRYPSTDQRSSETTCPDCGALTEQVAMYPRRDSRPISVATGGPILEALLDNIRSAYNVGSMFRTADGAGIRHLHLCGVTSPPNHRGVSKTALGAEETVPWTYYRNGCDAVASLRGKGFQIWGIEENARARSILEIAPIRRNTPIVLVMGNELAGVDPGILEQCDRVLCIPMQGTKESLNVAVAFGIVAYILRHAVLAN